MTLSKVGGGYQFTDGNASEIALGVQPTAATFSTSATLSTSQFLTGLIVADRGADSATAMTLPTVDALEAVLVNAHNNSSVDFTIVNVASGTSADITVTTNTGWTLVGLMVVQNLTSATFRAVKTGVGAWSLYAIS